MKDPIEILPPTGDRILVVLRAEQSGDRISFTLLDNLALDLGHGSAIEIESMFQCEHRLSNSRSQLSDGP